MPEKPENPPADWLQPPEEAEGLGRYVETIRERIWLIVAVTAITVLIAVVYVLTASKTYEASADVLVTPISGNDPVLSSLGLIGVSTDPTREVETASRLVTNTTVAAAVKTELKSSESAEDLLKKVSAVPVAESNIVAVTATAGSPEEAQELADAFAEQAVETRTTGLHEQIEEQLPILEEQITAGGGSEESPIESQVAQLELLASGPTPDMRVQTEASLPTEPASPRPVLSVIAGLIAGLILGLLAAFASQVLDPRLRREAQLRRLYRLPILARIPKESRPATAPLAPRSVSPVTREAYRTLRSTMTVAGPGRGQVVFVTGSGPSEGKSTTAINLAASLALSGRKVILIESDLRRPVLAKTLGVSPRNGGVVSVLIEKTEFQETLTTTELYGANLQLLLADYEGGWIAELFSIGAAERMIDDARAMADYVIIDSPPLNEVVDALPLVQLSDAVLLVVKLGVTRLQKLTQLGEMLAENSVRPTGFVVIGTQQPPKNGYHYQTEDDDKPPPRGLFRKPLDTISKS